MAAFIFHSLLLKNNNLLVLLIMYIASLIQTEQKGRALARRD